LYLTTTKTKEKKMGKVIIKASDKKRKGSIIKGTGPGCVYPEMKAQKFSKPFILKNGTFQHQFTCINCNTGDKVVFAYVN
jgi:hypothetical protein